MRKRVLLALALLLVLLSGWLVWREASDSVSRSGQGSPDEATVAPPPLDAAKARAPTLAIGASTPGKPFAGVLDVPHVSGRVVSRAGTGVAGARVVSIPDTNVKAFSRSDLGHEGSPGFAAAADREGFFAVEVAKDAPFHLLIAEAEGVGFGAKGAVRAGAVVTLVLEPFHSLVGTVKDREGKPVVGARVRALWLVDTMNVEKEAQSGVGGAYRIDGLPPVSGSGSTWRGCRMSASAEVTAEGFAPLFVSELAAGERSEEHRHDFTIFRGATLKGTVVEAASEKPVEGARVLLWSREGSMYFDNGHGGTTANPYGPRPLGETVSAEGGWFTFLHVPCPPSGRTYGIGGVVAWKSGFTAAAEQIPVAEEGAEIETTLRLWPAATVTGRVVEADGRIVGRAIVGARVKDRDLKTSIPSLYEGVPQSYTWTAESDGRFRIDGVPASLLGPTDVHLTVSRPYLPRGPSPREGGDATANPTVKAGETVDVGDIVLPAFDPVLTTTLVVLAPDGKPCFGAGVGAGLGGRNRTDAQGRMEFTWWTPKPGQTLPNRDYVVSAPGCAPTPVTLFPPGSGKETVTVTLLPAHRVAGRVALADGSPAAAVYVSVGDGALSLDEVFPRRAQGVVWDSGPARPGRALPLIYGGGFTDSDGRFAIEDLPDGPYLVLATRDRRVPGGPDGGILQASVSAVRANSADVSLRFPADDSPQTGTVTGQIVDGAGKPVTAPWTMLYAGESQVRGVSSSSGSVPGPPNPFGRIEAGGRFTLLQVPVGKYRLVAGAAGFRKKAVEGIEVRADETTDVPPLALEEGTVVAGQARPPPGLALKGRRLQFIEAGNDVNPRLVEAMLAADGSFRVGGFEPGAYRVLVGGDGHPDVPLIPAGGEVLIVRPGDLEVRFDVSLQAAGSIGLQPEDERLPPAPWNANGKVTEEQTKFGAATRVTLRGPDGTVLFDRTGVRRLDSGPGGWLSLLPGRYVARLEFPGGEMREETIDLTVGAMVPVMFRKR